MLLVALVAVVGDAKAVSPTIESGVEAAGMPQSAVGAVTVVPGRVTLLQGGVHLIIFAAFVFLAISP